VPDLGPGLVFIENSDYNFLMGTNLKVSAGRNAAKNGQKWAKIEMRLTKSHRFAESLNFLQKRFFSVCRNVFFQFAETFFSVCRNFFFQF
jgi:hypothetical protein